MVTVSVRRETFTMNPTRFHSDVHETVTEDDATMADVTSGDDTLLYEYRPKGGLCNYAGNGRAVFTTFGTVYENGQALECFTHHTIQMS